MGFLRREYRSISFRICIYPSESNKGYYVAHSLELDVIGSDTTVEGALAELLQAIETQLDVTARYESNPERLAPEDVWVKYGSARKLSAELLERVIDAANKRLGHKSPINVDTIVETSQVRDCCGAV
jgi:hypothetical protein